MKLASLLIIIPLAACTTAKPPSATDAAAKFMSTCVPAATELCPSDQWTTGYKAFKSLNDQIAKDQESEVVKHLQAEIDQSLGLQSRLRQMMPQGYDWDESKWKFVKAPTPATPAPPAGPKPIVDLNRHPVDGLAPNLAATPPKQPKR